MNTTLAQEKALYNLLESRGIEEMERVFKSYFAYSFYIREGESLFNKAYSHELFEHLYNANRSEFAEKMGDYLTTVEYNGYEKDSVFEEARKLIVKELKRNRLQANEDHLVAWLHSLFVSDGDLSLGDWVSIAGWYMCDESEYLQRI